MIISLTSKAETINLELRIFNLKLCSMLLSKNRGTKIITMTNNKPAKLRMCMNAFGTRMAAQQGMTITQRQPNAS
jgi:hypothetical protein